MTIESREPSQEENEAEYIRISHLTRVRCIRELTRNLCAEIDGVITQADLSTVARILSRWEQGLSSDEWS